MGPVSTEQPSEWSTKLGVSSSLNNTTSDEVLTICTEIKDSGHSVAYSVAFSPDGKHLLSGGTNGIRQWQVSDGQEVWRSLDDDSVYAIALSRDHKWIVSGSKEGATVWDAKSHDKVHQVHLSNPVTVYAADISPDSAKFATGTGASRTDSHSVNVWDITTGERIAGPLGHDDSMVVGVKFSPNGNHITTLTDNHIRIFNSKTGDQLIIIEHEAPSWSPITPIVWPSDGQLFVMSLGGKIKCFDTSTGSQLVEWQIENGSSFMSIALSTNNKFITSSAGHSVSFWDTSTHTQLGSILKDVDMIRSVALSPNGTHLATGGFNTTITIWSLRGILPESYLPIPVSATFPDV